MAVLIKSKSIKWVAHPSPRQLLFISKKYNKVSKEKKTNKTFYAAFLWTFPLYATKVVRFLLKRSKSVDAKA